MNERTLRVRVMGRASSCPDSHYPITRDWDQITSLRKRETKWLVVQ